MLGLPLKSPEFKNIFKSFCMLEKLTNLNDDENNTRLYVMLSHLQTEVEYNVKHYMHKVNSFGSNESIEALQNKINEASEEIEN